MKIIDISLEHRSLLETFIATLGGSANTFRYFARRPLEVISNHLCTKLLLDDNNTPIGYGHLDPDGDKVWLGVCLTEKSVGRGYGKRLMDSLIEFARDNSIRAIHLSVDNTNARARTLYEQYGFRPVEDRETLTVYQLAL